MLGGHPWGHDSIARVGQLEDAAKAHRDALAGLDRAKRAAADQITTARALITTTRKALAEVIVSEARAGTAQVEIIRRSGYSRERVRSILRAHGVEADG